MKHIYLIDSENVGKRFIDQLDIVKKNDQIYIFSSPHTAKIEFSDGLKMRRAECDISVIECCNGSANALDFQLTTFLGLRIKSSPKSMYHIVSGDTGFGAAVKFLNCMGYKVCLEPEITRQEYQSDKNIGTGGLIESTLTGTKIQRADGVTIILDDILTDRCKTFVYARIKSDKLINKYFISKNTGLTPESTHKEYSEKILGSVDWGSSPGLILGKLNMLSKMENQLGTEYNYLVLKSLVKKDNISVKDVFLKIIASIVYEATNSNRVNEHINKLEMQNKTCIKSLLKQNFELFLNKDATKFTCNASIPEVKHEK